MVKDLGIQVSNPLIGGLGPEDEVSVLLEGTVYEAPKAVATVASPAKRKTVENKNTS